MSEICTTFWLQNLKQRDLGKDGRIILKQIINKYGVSVDWINIWLWIGTSGRLFNWWVFLGYECGLD
jgi:hypothetical protein